MKSTNFTYRGKTYRLAFTAGALFDLYDKYGPVDSVLDLVEPTTKAGWSATCWLLEKMSHYGELQRRYLGEHESDELTAGSINLTSDPTDVARLKDAVRAAVYLGFSRSVEDSDDAPDVDLVLKELEEKKAPPSSAAE